MTENSAFLPRDAGPDQVEGILSDVDRLCRDRDSATFGEIVEALGAQSYGPLLLALSVLVVLPTGMIPGMGGAIGVIAILIGLQVLRGRSGLWLPAFVRDRRLPAHRIGRAVERIRPGARWLRQHLRPRLRILSEGKASLTAIAVILVLSGAMMAGLGFIPVIVPLIGLPLLFFALGLVSRDGAMVAAGYVLLVPPPLVAALWV